MWRRQTAASTSLLAPAFDRAPLHYANKSLEWPHAGDFLTARDRQGQFVDDSAAAPSATDALREVLHSSQELLWERVALLQHDAEVSLTQALRRAVCNLAALWCVGVALLCVTVATYLYLSTVMPPYAAAAGLGLLHLGAAGLLRAAPRAPAVLRRAKATLAQSTDAMRCTPPADGPAPVGPKAAP
jgi:hypothetical protein